MHRHRSIIGYLGLLAILAGALNAPIVFHAASAADDSNLHVVVHRHHGRVHVHVHERPPAHEHGPGCNHDHHHDHSGHVYHHDLPPAEPGHDCEGCGLQKCCADHAPQLWLSAERDEDWREHFSPVRIGVETVGELAQHSPALDAFARSAGRAPPGAAGDSHHLALVRPVILRL